MALYRNTQTREVKSFGRVSPLPHNDTWELIAESAEERAGFPSALDSQVGGSHYKNMAMQPVAFIQQNKIPYIEGCCIKYLCRWREKNGIEDLKKARHYLDILIEMEEKKC